MWKTVFLQSLHTILQQIFFWFIRQGLRPKIIKKKIHGENSILVITAFDTTKLNWFWFIREGPNMQKTIFLQSLHIILKNKILLMHHKMSQHEENSILSITAYNTSKENSFWCITQCSNMKKKQYSCNHCIQYFKRKFFLMHQAMFHQVENSNFAILLYSSLQNKICLDTSQNVPTSRK